MSRLCTILLSLIICCSCSFGDKIEYPTKALTIIGASFAYPENGWFELACEELGYHPINRAVSGSHIKDIALQFSELGVFTREEMDITESLVIMFTHDLDVYVDGAVYGDTLSDNPSNAECFDYVIRRYIGACQALEFDRSSKWYGVKGGKPADIILCTHWHDARVRYNTSVRQLARHWNGVTRLCEFDTQIGFSKDNPDPETGVQISVLYAHPDNGATEIIDGVEYGWHPKRGRDSEIQQKMAQIFCDCF